MGTHFPAFFFGSALGPSVMAPKAISTPGMTFSLNTAATDRPLLPFPRTHGGRSNVVALPNAIGRGIDLHRRKCAILDVPIEALVHKLLTADTRVGDRNVSALYIGAVPPSVTAQPRAARA